MTTNKPVTPLVAIVCTTLIWGLSFSSTKILLVSLTPEQIAFFRQVLAATALGLVFLASGWQSIRGRDALRMAAGGVAGIFLYSILENNGLRFTTAGI
jgi:drug/metabolite transporter (DMT)-like permease